MLTLIKEWAGLGMEHSSIWSAIDRLINIASVQMGRRFEVPSENERIMQVTYMDQNGRDVETQVKIVLGSDDTIKVIGRDGMESKVIQMYYKTFYAGVIKTSIGPVNDFEKLTPFRGETQIKLKDMKDNILLWDSDTDYIQCKMQDDLLQVFLIMSNVPAAGIAATYALLLSNRIY